MLLSLEVINHSLSFVYKRQGKRGGGEMNREGGRKDPERMRLHRVGRVRYPFAQYSYSKVLLRKRLVWRQRMLSR